MPDKGREEREPNCQEPNCQDLGFATIRGKLSRLRDGHAFSRWDGPARGGPELKLKRSGTLRRTTTAKDIATWRSWSRAVQAISAGTWGFGFLGSGEPLV